MTLDKTHLVGLPWTSDQPDTETSTSQHTTLSHWMCGRIQTWNSSKEAATDPHLRPSGHWDQL